jgi:hypothetical protein
MRTTSGSLVAIALTLAAATLGSRLAAQVGEIAFANSGRAKETLDRRSGDQELKRFALEKTISPDLLLSC